MLHLKKIFSGTFFLYLWFECWDKYDCYRI